LVYSGNVADIKIDRGNLVGRSVDGTETIPGAEYYRAIGNINSGQIVRYGYNESNNYISTLDMLVGPAYKSVRTQISTNSINNVKILVTPTKPARVIVFYHDASSNDRKAKVGRVAPDGTITLGPATTIMAHSNGPAEVCWNYAASRIVFAGQPTSGTSLGFKAASIDLNTDVLTLGIETSAFPSANADANLDCEYIGNDSRLVFAMGNTTSNACSAVTVSVSGLSVSVNGPQTIISSNNFCRMGVIPNSGTPGTMYFVNSAGAHNQCTSSSGTITCQGLITTSASDFGEPYVFANNSHGGITIWRITSTGNTAQIFGNFVDRLTASPFTTSFRQTFASAGLNGLNGGFNFSIFSKDKALVFYNGKDAKYYSTYLSPQQGAVQVSEDVFPAVSTGVDSYYSEETGILIAASSGLAANNTVSVINPGNIFGIAAKSVNSGELVPVIRFGGIYSGISRGTQGGVNFTPGSRYYYNTQTGNLSTTISHFFIGIGITPTKIKTDSFSEWINYVR
jgi:hypothetical protein